MNAMSYSNENETVLSVRGLRTSFYTGNGPLEAVRGVSFDLHRGEVLGIVGESGSGKTVTSLSILRLLPENGRISGGQILFDGCDLASESERKMRRIRGARIAMIFQDPMSSLNPLMPIGRQIAEMMEEHNRDLSSSTIEEEVVRLLEMVKIPEAGDRRNSYPHEFSGGMRQRVMIAMALACKPDILIADEPTTALDVTIQDQILKLLQNLRKEFGMSIMFITHDLGVVAQLCTRVIVMYGGAIMEEAPVDDIFERPIHPYTMGLLASVPNVVAKKSARLLSIPGSPPDMLRPPRGCPFALRCPHARNVCASLPPPLLPATPSRSSACWLLSPGAPGENNPFAKGENNHE